MSRGQTAHQGTRTSSEGTSSSSTGGCVVQSFLMGPSQPTDTHVPGGSLSLVPEYLVTSDLSVPKAAGFVPHPVPRSSTFQTAQPCAGTEGAGL